MIITIPKENKIIKNSDWEPNGIKSLKPGDKFSVYDFDWKILHYKVENEEKSYPINSIWIFRNMISQTELEVDYFNELKY